jgi:hypothetical protein
LISGSFLEVVRGDFEKSIITLYAGSSFAVALSSLSHRVVQGPKTFDVYHKIRNEIAYLGVPLHESIKK